jgi:WhiB family redox-sensing transcriptional regulator
MTEDELEQAACSNKDTNLWFPEGPPGSDTNSTEYAKSICATCPVQVSCLQQALAENMSGIWGGTTEAERTRMKRTRTVSLKIQERNVKANRTRSLQASQKAVALIQDALRKSDASVPPQLLMVAQLRVNNPTASLQELADIAKVTKDAYAASLRRFMQLVK